MVQLYCTNTTYMYVQTQLRADKRWTTSPIFSEIRWEGLFDAKLELETERERETHRLSGVAPPTFHLGYGPTINLVGELLVVVTETTGVDPSTAGRLKVKNSVCVCV